MNDDMQRLTEKLDRQRLQLSATNLALAAIASALTPEQQQHVLTTMAKASAEKQATFEQIPSPGLQASTPQHQAAEEQVFQLLQVAMQRYSRR